MIACFIRYELDPFKIAEFEHYARAWGQAIPECGADLIGYFAPHEGSATVGYGVYTIESLAAYETYRARLTEHEVARKTSPSRNTSGSSDARIGCSCAPSRDRAHDRRHL